MSKDQPGAGGGDGDGGKAKKNTLVGTPGDAFAGSLFDDFDGTSLDAAAEPPAPKKDTILGAAGKAFSGSMFDAFDGGGTTVDGPEAAHGEIDAAAAARPVVTAKGSSEATQIEGTRSRVVRARPPAPQPKGPPPAAQPKGPPPAPQPKGTPARGATAAGTPVPLVQVDPAAQATAEPPSTTDGDEDTVPSWLENVTPGTRIHQYELIRPIGSGGMGTVFLARDTKLGRRVAIKFLKSNHEELTKRFIIEARATARCGHENIVIIYEVGEYASTPYMVLEFLQGEPLNRVIRKGRRLPPARAVEIMVPVVRALVVAHEEGIVHRDLKPDNIFVTEAGTIKVLDFGIAKVLQGEGAAVADVAPDGRKLTPEEIAADLTGMTRAGTIMGTMSYMSPEQWGAGGEIDNRTDIWAVGIILFRILAGRHPLDPLTAQQLVITAVLDVPMPKLREAAPDVPAALAEVVDRCLAKRQEERYPDARALLKALEPFLPGRYTRELAIDESPYAGLSSFQEADADRFFGRAREVAAMVNRIRDRPLMAVVGPSGVGKSSFVRAGLVPALKHSGEQWETMVLRPGRQPLASLAGVLAPLVKSSTSVDDEVRHEATLAARLMDEPGYLGSALRARARREGKNLLLFVDQFEEIYTVVPDPKERLAFTRCLSGVADDATSPVRVVVSLRSDFLDRVAEDAQFMGEVSQGLFFLLPPDNAGLRDALVQPAEMAGFQFEKPEMVENMLEHLATTPGALPLLQFAATKLWDARDRARKLLTLQSYQAIGGIAGALASHADAVLEELSPPARAMARALFLRLVTSDRTRALVSMEELREISKDTAEIQRLIDHLVQARLLVVQTGGGAAGGTVEIVHESLIQTWPALRRWLDESQEDTAFLEQLRNAAKQWQLKNYDGGLLWRGEMAEEAIRFLRRFRGELPELQRAFLKAIDDHLAGAARRRRRFAIGGAAFLTLLLVAASIALVIISQSRREATRQAGAARKAEAAARTSEAAALTAEASARTSEATARKAEGEARKALDDFLAADKKRRELEATVGLTKEELAVANEKLKESLEDAEKAKDRAEKAQVTAERNAEAARAAQQEAQRQSERVAELLEAEKARVARLQQQLKGLPQDTLP